MITKYFMKGGSWQYDHVNATLSNFTTVNVGFSHKDCETMDETSFDIEKYNVRELNDLFDAFVEENNFKNVRVIYVSIVKTAPTLEGLEE